MNDIAKPGKAPVRGNEFGAWVPTAFFTQLNSRLFFEQQHPCFTTCFYNKLELLLLKKTASFQLLDIMIFQLYLELLSQVVVDVCTQH